MPRLYRPTVPIEVKVRVVLRQLGERFPGEAIAAARGRRGRLGGFLQGKLADLAKLLGCEVSDLRLDHDPPLGARPKRGAGERTVYTPGANDPEHLKYRPHGTQFEGSHDVKTRIRGDHGQLSDIALIKKNRRIERGPKPKRGPKMKGRGFPKPVTFPGKMADASKHIYERKTRWPKRPLGRTK